MTNNVVETIKKELRGIVRDKKSLLMMIVTPLMIPLFIFIFSIMYNDMIYNTEDNSYTIGVNYSLNSVEKDLIKEAGLVVNNYSSKEEMEIAFNEGNIDAYVILSNNKYIIYSNNMNENSNMASKGIVYYLDNYNNYLAQNYLEEIDADLNNVYNNINYDYEQIKGSNDLVDLNINMGFIFALMAITLTAVYGATDSTAGEKERGTLETFLTFPIKSNELILGKYLAISISCFVTSIISMILTLTSLSICKGMFEIYNDVVLNLNISSVSLVFIIMICYSLFISGLCIAIASFSKSYKEAQSALTPISILVMIPMLFDMFGIKINLFLSLIPIVNHSLLINDIICGNANIINIIVMFISTILYVILIIYFITKQYKSEKILFSI
ncbi:MAG: ABC transporter permease [Bacilli bacterium]